eukprot:TRINITY_DN20444_c0_g4_i1.p1 TRINITY_DN20444_c0_g4~~TRINITY_DN20444_c0_g4_i1.p1  ORF type:complete len:563 (+),score=78.43 TRINITY_DN20444_c0_g4_i1:85-1773(+)
MTGYTYGSELFGAGVEKRVFAFIFPMASGHINPSLPVARRLTEQGHEVHYLCREQMRDAIEDTGATFHSELQELTELYDGREPFLMGALPDLQKEFGVEDDNLMRAMCKLREIQLELMMPGAIRWLQKLNADVVVCCPLINLEAIYSAKFLGIPCVGLMTTAGPGCAESFFGEFMKQTGLTVEDMIRDREEFPALAESMVRLREKYGLSFAADDGLRPMGVMNALLHSTLTLVTTGEFLQDPMSPEVAQVYKDEGSSIVYVGPLLDKEGAKRAAGHKFDHNVAEMKTGSEHRNPLAELKRAKAAGRTVIFVSMGTVITGDSPQWGWKGLLTVDGKMKGFSGKELCQNAWSGAFDAFGSKSADEGPLLLVALGPQSDALDNLAVPPNALCLPIMPQVDLLKAGVDLFLTHGGQNSFMEALAAGVPVVVCPGFGDQPVNARKAESIGVGRHVERPVPELENVPEAAAAYRSATAVALREVLTNPSFRVEAQRCADSLEVAGGVPMAARLILELAPTRSVENTSSIGGNASSLPTLLRNKSMEEGAVDARKVSAVATSHASTVAA